MVAVAPITWGLVHKYAHSLLLVSVDETVRAFPDEAATWGGPERYRTHLWAKYTYRYLGGVTVASALVLLLLGVRSVLLLSAYIGCMIGGWAHWFVSGMFFWQFPAFIFVAALFPVWIAKQVYKMKDPARFKDAAEHSEQG